MEKVIKALRQVFILFIIVTFTLTLFPTSFARADTVPEIVIHYDGENADGIGITTGGTFEVAARYPAAFIKEHIGKAVDSVKVCLFDPAPIKLRIYEGTVNNKPEALIYSKDVSSTVKGWNEITLDKSILVGEKDLWVGYEVTHEAGKFPVGVDSGPANADGSYLNCDLLSYSWVKLKDIGFDWNFNIRVKLVIADTTKPVIDSFMINNGETLTNSKDVALTQSANDNKTPIEKLQMRFSNDNIKWSSWETFAKTKNWALEGEDGSKTVYLEVKDEFGNVATVNKKIMLDTKAPKVEATIPKNNDGEFIKDKDIKIGFNEIIVKGDKFNSISLIDASGKPISFVASIKDKYLIINPESNLLENTTYKLNLPEEAVNDLAGNKAKCFELSFKTKQEDFNPPTIKLLKVLLSGKDLITVYYDVTDDYTPAEKLVVRFSFDGEHWTEWEHKGEARILSVKDLGNYKYVYIQSKDLTGKYSIAKMEIPKKTNNIPKTGDFGTLPYLVVTLISGGILFALIISGKLKKDKSI